MIAPARHATASLSSAARVAHAQWTKSQVELHGQFPTDHVKRFEQYASQTSWLRAVLVCLWTPVPIAVIPLLIESDRLEDPTTHTARQSPHFWLRCFIMMVIATTCYLEQFRQHVPSLHLPRPQLIPIVLTGASGAVVTIYLLADFVAYPFPFSTNVAASACAVTTILVLRFVIRDQLRENPQLGKDLRRHLVVCACQIVMIAVYPIYNSVFVRVSSWGQTAMVLILPLIKLACKNCISRWIANSDEARAESVIFNVEVFHALYVSFSMQNSNAIHTIVAIMAVDFVQAWLSFRDIIKIVETIKPITSKLPDNHANLVSVVCRIIEADKLSPPRKPDSIPAKDQSTGTNTTITRVPTLETLLTRARVHPTAWTEPNPPDQQPEIRRARSPSIVDLASEQYLLSVDERALLVQQTQKLLFVTEFVALIEYTEVLMPCIFNLCISIMYSLPNRPYYAFLRHLTPDQLRHQILNVFLYASLEFVSLVVMGVILWRKLHLSLLHQIAFVLETRQASVQSKVIMWALNVLQNQADHAGVDYSFQFAWLKAKKTP